MKNKKIKWLLVSLVIVGLLTGCGNSKKDNDTDSDTNTDFEVELIDPIEYPTE